MPMQQMALLAYRAPPSGGDSAYLMTGNFDGADSSTAESSITFNLSPGPTGNVTYISNITEDFIWKTGPNAYDTYNARFNKTFQSGPNDISGSAVNTTIQMGVNTPSWALAAGALTSRVEGWLVILSSSQVELANVQIILQTNQFA